MKELSRSMKEVKVGIDRLLSSIRRFVESVSSYGTNVGDNCVIVLNPARDLSNLWEAELNSIERLVTRSTSESAESVLSAVERFRSFRRYKLVSELNRNDALARTTFDELVGWREEWERILNSLEGPSTKNRTSSQRHSRDRGWIKPALRMLAAHGNPKELTNKRIAEKLGIDPSNLSSDTLFRPIAKAIKLGKPVVEVTRIYSDELTRLPDWNELTSKDDDPLFNRSR
ncbi:hypothetical protein [Stieleria maiorica]|nr:hypothetical protein [Stieleria maiorica]